MTTDIFIRTYEKDIEWLGYALKSIHKYVTGYRNIIVCIPHSQVKLLSHLTAEKVVGVSDLDDGYLGQQLTKMQAWQVTDADAVAFWDSDVMATCPIDIQSEYFVGGKPIMYKTRYASIPGCPWQVVTEKAVQYPVVWEYMRRMPIVHLRRTLEVTEQYMVATHGMSLDHYIRSQPLRHFSEFNVIGAIAEARLADQYTVLDTEAVDMPPNKVDQNWSWGGITDEVMDRFRKYGLVSC